MDALEFITVMKATLARGVDVQGMRVVIDSIDEESTPLLSFLSIYFHLEGPNACTASFTYTFFSGNTIDENLADLADFVREQNPIASTAPEAAAAGGSASS